MDWILQQLIFCNALKSVTYKGCKPEQHLAYLQAPETQLRKFCLLRLSRIFELTNGLFLIYCILRETSSFMNADR